MRFTPPTPLNALLAATALLLAGAGQGAASSIEGELRDLYFGEALYYAYQEQYFEALERLDTEIALHYGVDEPELDSLRFHIDHAEFSVGDFELYYRMHHRAGRAIQAVMDANVPEPVRNEAAYRLARIHFQKDQPQEALIALDSIEGKVPESIRSDVELLRANILMALGNAAGAVEVLRQLEGAADVKGFSTYNLGIALLRDDQPEQAIRELDRAGQVKGADRGTLAIRDRSNLALGTLLFEAEAYGPAQSSLDRVRLNGPFSNLALLRAGWADMSAENFERALVPWSILTQRDPTDAAVQEAILALPQAYNKLEVHGRAALLYGRAVETFGSELQKVDASIGSIRNGEFLAALVREEIRQDKDWVIHLRGLPDTPETFYLVQLMASHSFQTALQNYLDLEDLRKKLASWYVSLDSFVDMLKLRRAYYEPILPQIDGQFRKLDAQVRLRTEQRNHLRDRLHQMLTTPRPEQLATAEEMKVAEQLDRIGDATPEGSDPQSAQIRERIERLRGVLTWQLETRYHERLTLAHDHLRELEADMEALSTRYEAFVRTRQAASHSYEGYDASIARLRTRIDEALQRVRTLMSRQGHLLEGVAIAELTSRRERLAAYQNQARFAFADSYDRAAKAQAR